MQQRKRIPAYAAGADEDAVVAVAAEVVVLRLYLRGSLRDMRTLSRVPAVIAEKSKRVSKQAATLIWMRFLPAGRAVG